MEFITFLIKAVIISLSGVLAPGAVTAVTVGKGSESKWAGAWISVGHGIVEVPLMIGLLFGIGAVLKLTAVDAAVGLLGGAFLLYMSYGMFKDLKTASVNSKKDPHSPLVAGMLLSIGNPYFLVWWAIIGIKLVKESIEFGALGFVTFAVVHWICDLVWLTFLSFLAWKGRAFYGKKFQQGVFIVCGTALLFFGISFIWDAATKLLP